jgi:hypothetical protein
MEMIDTDITNHVQNAILECQMQGMPMNDIKLIDVQPFKRPEIGPDVIEYRLVFTLKDPDAYQKPFENLIEQMGKWDVHTQYPCVTFVSVSMDKK